jgi:hypothetical protein
VNSDSSPSRRCSEGGFYFAAVLTALFCLGCVYCVFKSLGFGVDNTKIDKKEKVMTFFLKSLFVFFIFGLIASSVVVAFMDEYPQMRCKNDDAFAVAITMYCLAIFVMLFAYLHIRHKILRILPFNDELKVIQVASENMNRRLSKSTSSFGDSMEVFHRASDTDCFVCKKRYSKQRPGVVTKCGHVWCSDCIVQECKLFPPTYAGLCGVCGCIVKKYDIVLLKLKESPGIPLSPPSSTATTTTTTTKTTPMVPIESAVPSTHVDDDSNA